MAGTKKLILTLSPTEESKDNAVYEVMRAAQMEASKKNVALKWKEEDADPV